MTLLSRRRVLEIAAAVIFLRAGALAADADEASLVRAMLPSGLQPLLALIVDDSAATALPLMTRETYDADRDYRAGLPAETACDPRRTYWRRGTDPAPDCRLQVGLETYPADGMRGLRCRNARTPLAEIGYYVASRAAQWRTGSGGGRWTALDRYEQSAVHCRADGDPVIAWDRAPHADSYTFYSGNFLNWLRAVPADVPRPMAEIMRRGLADALRATDGVDVGWLRFAASGDGAFVARAPVPVEQAAADWQSSADGEPAGTAPLAGALVEAAFWLSGAMARAGTLESADPAAYEPSSPGRYRSPITHACRPVTLAYLTAGQPSNDAAAASAADALPGFRRLTGGCGGDCIAAVANWFAVTDLLAEMPGRQSAPLHWLVPGPPSPAVDAGLAGTIARLDDPLTFINLVAASLQHDAAVPAGPRLSTAAWLPPASPSDTAGVVFGLSAPRPRQRWFGNLLRYGMRRAEDPFEPPVIVDRDGEPAIDAASGLPRPTSRSLWSDAPDADLLSGGAAGRLPTADVREIHSDLGDSELLGAGNRLQPGNPRIDRSLLGLGADDPESPQDLLDWLAGARELGDPGANAAAVAAYPDGRQVVFSATHDGLLQAFDAASGIELWAWMPRELLPTLPEKMRDGAATVRNHGIDGPLVLHRHDPDGDGLAEPGDGEHLWLMFGLGRGGNRYYALDVADPDRPQLLWSVPLPGPASLEGRAEPVVTRIRIDGATQNAGLWVVLIPGGYDRHFDEPDAGAVGDGNALYLFDALTGEPLWSAGPGDDPNLQVDGLNASLSAAPRALDLDGDGHLDRAYAIDVTGGLWRFDFASGRPADVLAQARRIARLGTGPQRFHETPDVSLARLAAGARLAIAVGSGWLARPLDTGAVDRIYVLFDRDSSLTAPERSESDLHDAGEPDEPMPASAPGWYRRLDGHGAGEKVIGPAITFDHVVRFQTFQPLPLAADAPCGPPRSVRRLYALDVRSGVMHDVADEAAEEEPLVIEGDGLPVALRFGFPGAASAGCLDCRGRAYGLTGGTTFDTGYAGDPVRTSWRKLELPPDSR